MKILAAGLATETNTFLPFPTGERAFLEAGTVRRDGSQLGEGVLSFITRHWREMADGDGNDFVESLTAFAEPSGRTVRPLYERYREEILEDLAASGPIDVVLLALHGAMAAEGYDDCEGDLLATIRRALGPKPIIGAVLDPHAHLTSAMLDNSDLLIFLKEYPHVDFLERATELYRLSTRAAAGDLRPKAGVFDCRMIGFYPTTQEPMAGYVRSLTDAEGRNGILSASLIHGFPWADVADVGSKVLVYADGDEELAECVSRELGESFVALREELAPNYPGVERAIDLTVQTPGLCVLADTADNPGGGAPGDNMTLLRRLMARGISGAACGIYWDPMAVLTCQDAGVGARLRLRIGGKAGTVSGDPLDLDVIVKAIREGHSQTGLGGTVETFGTAVWLESAGNDIVIANGRTQVLSPDAFTGLGIDLSSRRIVAIKSSHHFYAAFDPIAARVIHVATPGALEMDFANLNYTKRHLQYWPRVPDPFGAGASP